MHIWLVEKLYGYNVFAKSQFSLPQRNKFLFNYHGGCETLRWLTASQSQLKVIINPTKLIISITVMRFK